MRIPYTSVMSKDVLAVETILDSVAAADAQLAAFSGLSVVLGLHGVTCIGKRLFFQLS